MNKPLPNELPCFTTADEQKGIVNGQVVAGLAAMLAEPPTRPIDPQLLENEKLWQAGDKDGWLKAELDRLESMDWSKK